jgi:hypothetical protein
MTLDKWELPAMSRLVANAMEYMVERRRSVLIV